MVKIFHFDISIVSLHLLLFQRNSTLIDAKVERTDVEVFYIPATQIAKDEGMPTLSNMVLLGHVMGHTDAVSFDNLKETFETFIPAKKAGLIDLNCKALKTGYDY